MRQAQEREEEEQCLGSSQPLLQFVVGSMKLKAVCLQAAYAGDHEKSPFGPSKAHRTVTECKTEEVPSSEPQSFVTASAAMKQAWGFDFASGSCMMSCCRILVDSECQKLMLRAGNRNP